MNNADLFLIDRDFLRLLDLDREKEVFAKVILLDFQENIIEEIEGRVTQGSVSVDGTSSVRRTCSVTLAANELNIHEYYWGLHSKFQLYIGLKNVIKQRPPYQKKYKQYPDLCWFKMGTYIISSFNTSQTTNQYTISIQGKDKMTLLNGEVGGIITPLSWDFGKIDEISADGTIAHNDYLIKDIILEAVHEHAKEPYWNIIINDLEDCGLELLEYRGDIPLYLLYGLEEGVVVQTYFDLPPEIIGDKNIDEINFDHRITKLEDNDVYTPDVFPIEDEHGNIHEYTIIKAEYGDVIGYRTTDLVYAGDLISNVGETVTSMLDKIIAMLGSFEYFYDLDGHFVFQRKRAYVKNLFVPAGQVGANDGSQTAAETSSVTYSFDNSMLVTSFSNAPDFANLKNDFSLWGVRTGVSGIEIPIHLRYAIDTKPWYYAAYNGKIYITEDGVTKYNELIEAHKEWLRKFKEAEAEKSGKTVFKKIAVPYFLQNEDGSSDWWDITNWAEYYKLLTGEYPNQVIGDYGTEGFTGQIIFPNGDTFQKSYGQLVIDLERDSHNLFYGNGPTVDSRGHKMGYKSLYCRAANNYAYDEREYSGTWNPTQHGFGGCVHTYSEFLYLDANNNCQSFIYKPEIPASVTPDQIIVDIEDIVIEDEGKLDEEKTLICDWREIIYQMSLDKNKHQHDDDFLVTVDNNNTLPDGTHLYLGGATGYEQYYVDINGFWRDLYDPNYQFTYHITWVKADYFNTHKDEFFVYQNCSGMSYAEAMAAINAWKTLCGDKFFTLNYRNQWVTVSTIEPDYFNEHSDEYYFIRRCDALATGTISFEALNYNANENYFTQTDDDYDKETYWSSEFINNPEGINFWFDFLDSESELGKYKVCKVGDRAKAANDTNIKSIYFRDVPTVIFVDSNSNIAEEKRRKGTGYTYIQLPDYLENLFSMSSQGKSAMDILDDWLYSFAYCAESITLNTLPIYYLEPNARIFVRDDNSGINGEYIVTRLTIPLTHNGTMSISATKAVENLY